MTTDKIEYLEAENRRLRLREKQSGKMLKLLISKLPMASAILGPDLMVIHANDSFIKIMGHHAVQLSEHIPALEGAALRTLVTPELLTAAESTHNTGRDIERKDIQIDNQSYVLSSFSVAARELTMLLLRPMSNPEACSEEMVLRLNQTVDRNMKMIQQVAFLLGEEASENAKVIGSVIKLLQTPVRNE